MLSKQFWNDRALKYGHTGHAEPFYYCFDQEARKFAIRELIKDLSPEEPVKALDFGCGSGDFLELLLEKSDAVFGYDLSEKVIEKAKQTYASNPAVFLSDDISEAFKNGPYSLLLSVTVLQYLDASGLKEMLQALYKVTKKGGYLLSLEAFPPENSNYSDRAKENDWLEAIRRSGFKLTAAPAFYNPVLFPTASWHQYNRSLYLKLLKPLKWLRPVQRLMANRARQIIYAKKDILHDQNSTFKVYILQK